MNKSQSIPTRRFGDRVFNPFEMFVPQKKTGPKSKAAGKYNYHQEKICMQCDEEVARR